jgi:hypothetical protein
VVGRERGADDGENREAIGCVERKKGNKRRKGKKGALGINFV